MRKIRLVTEPVVVLIYGDSGSGKTTDCGYSFPNALFVANKGALQSIRHTCGYQPAQVICANLVELIKLLEDLAKKGCDYTELVIDDFTTLVERTMSYYEGRFQGHKFWGAIKKDVLRFRSLARDCNMHVILTCHERDPRTNERSEFIRGGPNLTGKLSEEFASECDIVLRCGTETMLKGFQGIYRCKRDSRFVMKCRFDTCYYISPLPMNLGEILRAVSTARKELGYEGFEITRHPSFPEQEAVVEDLSNHLAQFPDFTSEVNTLYTSLIEKGVSIHNTRWTLRDAIDRTLIRRALSTKNSMYYAV